MHRTLRRTLRLTRLGLHLALGVALVGLAYPWLGPRQRAAVRARWCRWLLATLGVRLQVAGAAPAQPVLVAANHVSWLDVFAIGAALPCTFVSKHEARSWPVFGWLAAHNETLFLRRNSARAAHALNRHVAARLAGRETVAIFPEGTTSDGSQVLPFNAALFQPAVDAACRVLPVAVQYYDHRARPTTAAAYVGDDPLWKSLRAVLDAPSIHVHLFLGDCLQGAGVTRRALAARSREAVVRLQSPTTAYDRALTGCAGLVRWGGKRAMKRLPLPTSLSISRVAWWRASACFTIARPRPVPPVSRERLRSTR
jgi:1-acyl-sn-glycerol-3-phosphate acyltransferase